VAANVRREVGKGMNGFSKINFDPQILALLCETRHLNFNLFVCRRNKAAICKLVKRFE
jgi:hypothetical protein